MRPAGRMYTILTDEIEYCWVCGRRATEMHHVFHGPDKALSERLGLMAPLCRECHNRVHHVGGELDQELKQEAQRIYLQHVFGRCYL